MKLTSQLVFTAMLLLAALDMHAQWTNVGSAGFSSTSTNYTSIVFDSNDTPYVAYIDNNKATVKKYNGSNWDSVGNTQFSATSVNYLALAIDGNNTPYVIYADNGVTAKASVMKYDGSSWVYVGSQGFSQAQIYYATIAFDNNNVPYVSFRDRGTTARSKALVMKYDGSNWVTVGSAGFSQGIVTYPSLAFNSSNVPYIAYKDGSYGATVMRFNGTDWDSVGNQGFSGATSNFTSLAINSNDELYIAYSDGANSSYATVMKYNGSNWVPVGTAGFSAGSATYTSLAINNNDIPYIAYKDNANGGAATVMKYDGNNWVAVGSAGFSANIASYTSLAFDSNDIPYVVYADGSNNNRATVMKYETNTWDGNTWSAGTPDSTGSVFIKSSLAPASFSCNDITIGSGYSLNTGTSDIVTIYGDMTNNGNGVSGTGTLVFTKDGTATLIGDTISYGGTIITETGCTLATAGLLRLTSDATGTGSIGNSSGTISGNVMAQRYHTGKRAFRFYAHPFSSSIGLNQLTDEIDITGSGGAANGFTNTSTNNPSAYWFDITTADNSTTGNNPGWVAFTNTDGTGNNSWDQYELVRLLVRGAKGEGLSGGSYTPSAATFECVGAINQGTQVITLTKGSNSDFVGCGNPYPSGVQMSTLATGSNVGANYYAWDATSGSSGAYVTNPWTLPYVLPAYSAFFTTVSANSNNTLTFEEADKDAGGSSLFKTTGVNDWVELYLYDSTTKWDRLLIRLDNNAMAVMDPQDGKKLYNPGLDFFTLSQDDVRLAVDVRPYKDSTSIPLGLAAYNRYNKYVIKTGLFNIPAGAQLILHDKYLNKTKELKPGFEYWFEVTTDSLSQGNKRFEINMQDKPTGVTAVSSITPGMQLIPNPAYNEVLVSFKELAGKGRLKIMNIAGQTIYSGEVPAGSGSVTISLVDVPQGVYIVDLEAANARFTEKMIKQ